MNKKSHDYLLLKRIKENDQEAFEEFYHQNEPLVYSLLKKYAMKTSDYEELAMCAKYGLVLAIHNFDLSMDVMFSTYAVPLILGEIKTYFRSLGIVRLSRRITSLKQQIYKATKELENKLNRSPKLEEISSYLSLPLEEIIEAYEASSQYYSLDEEIQEDLPRIEIIKDNNYPFIDKIDLKMAIEQLDKKEKLIITLRYYDGLSQKEVSERLNVSQVQVSRIETKTLNKLKEMMF